MPQKCGRTISSNSLWFASANQCREGRRQKGGNANAKLLQHQRLSERESLKRTEEKHRDRDQLPQFVLQFLVQRTHATRSR